MYNGIMETRSELKSMVEVDLKANYLTTMGKEKVNEISNRF